MLKRFKIMADTQAIDVVTFDFKGLCVHCFVSGSTDIKWISLRCKRFLNDHSLQCENLIEMCSYVWNWQT